MFKIKKIILIGVIFVLIAVFTANATFAASNETINNYKIHQINTYDKNIIKADYVSEWGKKLDEKSYLDINIKTAYKNKYKIKSIRVRCYNEKLGTVYKTYNIKNKVKIKLNFKSGVYLNSFTVSYYTKGKIKNETINLESRSKWKSTTHFYGKKANITLKKSGYTINTYLYGPWPMTNYQEFKITTKNKKYKIKTVKAFCFGMDSIERVNTYKGYGRNVLTVKTNKIFDGISFNAFKLYYY